MTEQEIIRLAKTIADEYRAVAKEMERAASVLDCATSVEHSRFPLVRITRLKRAIELGVVLDAMIDRHKVVTPPK